MGGCLGVVGYDDRPPVKEALDACGFHAEMMAAAGAMFALMERGVITHIHQMQDDLFRIAADRYLLQGR